MGKGVALLRAGITIPQVKGSAAHTNGNNGPKEARRSLDANRISARSSEYFPFPFSVSAQSRMAKMREYPPFVQKKP